MKPGIKRIIVGVIICFLGTFVAPLAIILPFVLEKSNVTQFMIPGTQEVNVGKPGRYYLWNDFETVYDGKSYNRSKSIPDGIEIKIQNANGVPFPFVSDTSISSRDNGSAKNSIGYVEIETIGKVEINVSGGDEQRIFSFEQSNLFKMVGLIISGIGLAVFITICGIGIIVWGAIKLIKSNRKIPA